MAKYKNPRDGRIRGSSRANVFENRQAKLETDVGVKLVGDNDPRRSGRTPDGEYACF